MSLRRHHAAPALEVSVLVAAGVSKGRCAATTRPLPSAAHTSISTAPACCRRPPTVRRTPCCRRHRRARTPPLLLLLYIEATATSQAPVREACFLGFPLDFYFRGTKYVQHFEGLYLCTSQSIAFACSYFFFHTICPCLFSSFWPCLSSASSSKAQWVNIISEDFWCFVRLCKWKWMMRILCTIVVAQYRCMTNVTGKNEVLTRFYF